MVKCYGRTPFSTAGSKKVALSRAESEVQCFNEKSIVGTGKLPILWSHVPQKNHSISIIDLTYTAR